MRYVDLLIDYLARNGTIDMAVLYESPFSSLAPRGPEDLFTEAEIDSVDAITKSVRATAVADESAA